MCSSKNENYGLTSFFPPHPSACPLLFLKSRFIWCSLLLPSNIFVASFAAVSLPFFFLIIFKGRQAHLAPYRVLRGSPQKKLSSKNVLSVRVAHFALYCIFCSCFARYAAAKNPPGFFFYAHLRCRLGFGGIPVFSQVHASTSAHNRSSCCHIQ